MAKPLWNPSMTERAARRAPAVADESGHRWDLPVGSVINIDLGDGSWAGCTTLTPIRVEQRGGRHHIVTPGTVRIERHHVFTGQEIRLVASAGG